MCMHATNYNNWTMLVGHYSRVRRRVQAPKPPNMAFETFAIFRGTLVVGSTVHKYSSTVVGFSLS